MWENQETYEGFMVNESSRWWLMNIICIVLLNG